MEQKTTAKKPFGWLIAGTMLGAMVGGSFASGPATQKAGRRYHHPGPWQENPEVIKAEKIRVWTAVGGVFGALFGAFCDRVHRKVALREALVLFAVATIVLILVSRF
ncbi:MAG: hypothetical protein Tsb009_35670 [Planctomycetaceae bacterium]